MSKISTLENSVINLNVLREDSQKELLSLLDNVGKNICLVLDPDIAACLNHILIEGTSALKNHGVKDFQELGKKRLQTNCANVVYIVRPVIKSMRIIASHIKDSSGSKGSKSKSSKFYLYFVPKSTLICEEVLKKEGVFGSITISQYPLDLVPYDDDILSLELKASYRQLYLDNDNSCLHIVAHSITKLQTIFGLIPNVKIKGDNAKAVWQMMLRFKRQQEAEGNVIGVLDPEIDTLVIMDRSTDLVTPMCTPLTYEGLIDEVLGVKNGFVQVDASVLADEDDEPPPPDAPPVSLPLNSNDKLYAEIRDFNIEAIGTTLQEQAKEIRERYDEFRKNKDASISEIREFVKRIPGLKQKFQSLQQNLNLAELIKTTSNSKSFRKQWTTERTMLEGDTVYDQLEEMIGNQEPLMKVLRLLCLQSLTNGGIKAKNFDFLRREILQTYGYEVLFMLCNLEKAGLIKRRETLWADSSTFSTVRKPLRLIRESVNVTNPGDIAYVTSGYAPLSIRLVEAATGRYGWKSIQEPIRQIPGFTDETSQVKKDEDTTVATYSDGFGDGERKVMVVYFIGGVTYMEIAALRYVARQQDCPYDIIVATTSILNGKQMLMSMIDHEMLHDMKPVL